MSAKTGERFMVSAKHACAGEGCTFCEWSNPPMFDLPPSEPPAVDEADGAD